MTRQPPEHFTARPSRTNYRPPAVHAAVCLCGSCRGVPERAARARRELRDLRVRLNALDLRGCES